MTPILLLSLLGGTYIYIKNNEKKPDLSKLFISKDCQNYYFGDGTGDKWWEVKGRPFVNKFIHEWKNIDGVMNPLHIAFRVLNNFSQTCPNNCFQYAYQEGIPNGFPMLEFEDLAPEDIGLFNLKELEYQRIKWIKNNKKMWNLIWQIRNRIDKEFFGGSETVEIYPSDIGKTNVMRYGKSFDYNKFSKNFLDTLSAAALEIENKKAGSLISWLTDNDSEWNTAIFMMNAIFPNLTEEQFKKWATMGKGNISQNELFQHILDKISKINGNEIEIDFDPYK